jgi:hypothetical protein
MKRFPAARAPPESANRHNRNEAHNPYAAKDSLRGLGMCDYIHSQDHGNKRQKHQQHGDIKGS